VPQNWIIPQKVHVGTPKHFNHRLNLLEKQSQQEQESIWGKKKMYPERRRKSNYPKAMLLVTTPQAETTFKDKYRQTEVTTPFGYHRRLLVDRGKTISGLLFVSLFQTSHKPAKIFMKKA
jgi:hypothetical protein